MDNTGDPSNQIEGTNLSWTIKHINLFPMNGEVLKTPPFAIEGIPDMYWHVKMQYASRGLTLKLTKCKKFTKESRLQYLIRIKAKDSEILHNAGSLHFQFFSNSCEIGCLKYTHIFAGKLSELTTVMCNFQPLYDRTLGSAPRSLPLKESLLRSVILTETRQAEWLISKFSTYNEEQSVIFDVPGKWADSVPIRMALSFNGEFCSLNSLEIYISLMKSGNDPLSSSGRVKLVTSSGNVMATSTDLRICRNREARSWVFPRLVGKNIEASENICCYLPDDVLIVQLEFKFSAGNHYTFIQSSRYTCPTKKIKDDTRKRKSKSGSSNDSTKISCTSSKQENIYEEPKFNELDNRGGSTFKVADKDPNVLKCLSYFMSHNDLNCENWEEAKKLYILSFRDGLSDLQRKTRQYLKDSLSIENVCDFLQLAHDCLDCELRAAAEDFVSDNVKNVLLSDKWRVLQKDHPKVACATMVNYRLRES